MLHPCYLPLATCYSAHLDIHVAEAEQLVLGFKLIDQIVPKLPSPGTPCCLVNVRQEEEVGVPGETEGDKGRVHVGVGDGAWF